MAKKVKKTKYDKLNGELIKLNSTYPTTASHACWFTFDSSVLFGFIGAAIGAGLLGFGLINMALFIGGFVFGGLALGALLGGIYTFTPLRNKIVSRRIRKLLNEMSAIEIGKNNEQGKLIEAIEELKNNEEELAGKLKDVKKERRLLEVMLKKSQKSKNTTSLPSTPNYDQTEHHDDENTLTNN